MTVSIGAVTIALGFALGCAQTDSLPFSSTMAGTTSRPHLIVASGSCYGGGVTTSTPSSTVVAYDLNTAQFSHVLVDYNALSPGDQPMGVQEYNSTTLMVVVENAAGRRIDLVKKDGSGVTSFLTNSTALNGVFRALNLFSDGSILVSKSTAVEKFSSSKARILQGANPYINAPAGTCATSTTLISSLAQLGNGKILYTHAAATPNNKFGLISATGYAVAGDCLGAQAAPTTTALPSAVVVHPSGKVLVAYGSTTTASNFIYSYDVNPTTNAISGATSAYLNASFLFGPSAMAVDPATNRVYVANAASTFNNIEEFSLSAGVLTRMGSKSFIDSSVFTRCASGLLVTGMPE